MNADYITLTDIDVERCMTPNGGLKSETVRLLGEDMRIKGWRVRLRGRKVLRADYDQARMVASAPKLRHVQNGEAKGQTFMFG